LNAKVKLRKKTLQEEESNKGGLDAHNSYGWKLKAQEKLVLWFFKLGIKVKSGCWIRICNMDFRRWIRQLRNSKYKPQGCYKKEIL